MRTRIRVFPGITLHWGSKDGGPASAVFMYGIECKALASVLVLRFEDGSRDAYHNHAFNANSWVLRGLLHETQLGVLQKFKYLYRPEILPIVTRRERTHKVVSFGRTWVLSLRGPWTKTWVDIDGATGAATVLRSGRVAAVVA